MSNNILNFDINLTQIENKNINFIKIQEFKILNKVFRFTFGAYWNICTTPLIKQQS